MTAEDQTLLESFEALTIPLEEWNQRTHVSLAYLYVKEHGFDCGLEKMRRGIQAFNAHNGIHESPTSGYNETTTVALFRIVDTVMRAYQEVLPTASAAEFCDAHPQLMSKHVLRLFYSPGRRMDPRAKTQFLEPDLAPLPVFREGDTDGKSEG